MTQKNEEKKEKSILKSPFLNYHLCDEDLIEMISKIFPCLFIVYGKITNLI